MTHLTDTAWNVVIFWKNFQVRIDSIKKIASLRGNDRYDSLTRELKPKRSHRTR